MTTTETRGSVKLRAVICVPVCATRFGDVSSGLRLRPEFRVDDSKRNADHVAS
jgi:hypothetical protein